MNLAFNLKKIGLSLIMLNGFISFSQSYSHQDTLRGSIGAGRLKWNVLHYDITVKPDINNKTIEGINIITLVDSGINKIQLDLQEPMVIDSIISNNHSLSFSREGNVYWVYFIYQVQNAINTPKKITVYFHGKPKVAKNAPWDGGWVWTHDKQNNPWVSVACQGLGASVWFPCKDTQSDEPDNGARLNIIVPDTLQAIGNGRLTAIKKMDNHLSMYCWEVKSPINNYDIIPYIGKYDHFSELYQGLNGPLDMDYWVLSYNLEKAKIHFTDAGKMIKAFEYWFGPYPFYEDGYKLVDAPYLGMEHQSAVAYGNNYVNGYMGHDRSNTGWGMKWDFIIVHESGHEWFGNNITTKDIADMWVHESFTNYSEVLFTEYYYGKNAADEYVSGLRNNISNDVPIIGVYNVNKEGSGDMYDKGANLIHTIREIINDDIKFRDILIGLNKQFYHKTVTTSEIESYIIKNSGFDFSKIFDQYLRTTNIPVMEYYFRNNQLHYRFTNTVEGFQMPVKYTIGNNKKVKLMMVCNKWQSSQESGLISLKDLRINKNIFIETKEIAIPAVGN
ncbi:MAG: M1 family metallopeptidase [Bacteroidota bacterium]